MFFAIKIRTNEELYGEQPVVGHKNLNDFGFLPQVETNIVIVVFRMVKL